MEDGERRKTYCLFVSFLLWVIFPTISVKFSRVHVWLKEIVGEERNKNKRGREKISEKKCQSYFHCLVRHEIYLFLSFFFSSPTSLSSHLLIFIQTKYANSLRRTFMSF